jgi:hypothetical protein
MKENIDLGKIEKKAWTAYFQDGLWDIFIASMMLTMAIRTLTDNVWFTLGMFIGFPIMVIGKKFITIPRLGFAKFGPKREAKRMKLLIVIFLAVISTCILLLLPLVGQKPSKDASSLFMAIFLMVVFSSIAYFLDFNRLYIYGLMFAVNEIVWGRFGEPTGPYLILIFGVIVLIIGLIILFSFMQKYPLYKEDGFAN